MPKPEFFVRSLLNWYARNARDLPWRKTTDPYAIWVSEIMLQQTQVKTVIPYWDKWMRRFPTVGSLAKAETDQILKCWEGLGYYTRARNLHQAAKIIVCNHEEVFPERFEDIIALPGIGRYTVGAICSIAFNQPTPILDGNVTRVLCRVFGIATNSEKAQTKTRLWTLAEQLVQHAGRFPDATARTCGHFNQALMELGATVCKPRQPLCDLCPLRKCCFAYQNNRVAELPKRPSRRPSLARRIVAFVLSRNGRFLVRRRLAGAVNAQLWEFPNLEASGTVLNATRLARKCLGFPPHGIQMLCSVTHSITRYRIRLDVFAGTTGRAPKPMAQNARWCTLKQLANLAFPSAHRKIVQALEEKATRQRRL